MRVPMNALAALVLVARPLAAAAPPAEGPGPAQVRAAVARSLPLLQKGAAGYADQRQCFSCHNQTLPLLALTTARPRGFAVSDQEVRRQVEFTADSLRRGRDDYRKGKGQGGQADTAGYALFALDVAGWQPDATTAAVAEYLLLRDRGLGYWKARSNRPPSEASSFSTTYLALRGLKRYATAEQQKRVAERTERALRWLRATPARDTEDRVFRLWGLQAAGAPRWDVRAAARELMGTQRGDGGWAQTERLGSDAYATGSALVVLHHAGGLAVSDPAYRRGLRFLVESQLADGSWKVRSRSRPFQKYLETGFPHGKDQFISISASGWAATALGLACPDATKGAERLTVRPQME
jgi:squalene cyclase